MTDRMIELVVPPIKWFSPGDEAAFYRWLTSLDAYVESKTRENILHITLDASKIDREAACDVVALFYRYRINDLEQLRALENPRIRKWFRDVKNYWTHQVFRS